MTSYAKLNSPVNHRIGPPGGSWSLFEGGLIRRWLIKDISPLSKYLSSLKMYQGVSWCLSLSISPCFSFCTWLSLSVSLPTILSLAIWHMEMTNQRIFNIKTSSLFGCATRAYFLLSIYERFPSLPVTIEFFYYHSLYLLVLCLLGYFFSCLSLLECLSSVFINEEKKLKRFKLIDYIFQVCQLFSTPLQSMLDSTFEFFSFWCLQASRREGSPFVLWFAWTQPKEKCLHLWMWK